MEDRNGEGVGNSNGIGNLIQHTYMYYIKNKTFSRWEALAAPLAKIKIESC